MTSIDPENVAEAVEDSLRRLNRTAQDVCLSIERDIDLLDIIDPFEFTLLIMDLEASLDVDLPLDQIDVASIARIDRLIAFICRHG